MALPRTQTTFAPPVMEARRWLDGVEHPVDRPLLNVSQAAPVDPPPLMMRQAMARMIVDHDETHLYGPVLGLPALRDAVAARWSTAYGGDITPDQVAITSGCNQAFAASIATVCAEGDEVIVPVPYYFNHRMWLDMSGVKTVALTVGDGMIPSAQDAARLITDKTTAIALVSPNNPCGVEYPAETLCAFRDLCRQHGIALIVDETYRDFDRRDGAPHALFADPDWDATLIHLYSFSKAYRLTGHRVGAVITGEKRLREIEKFLDTVAICPNQLGQAAALWGIEHLDAWLAGERLEILDRRAAIADGFSQLKAKGWELLGCGAYFAYVKHPFDEPSDVLAQRAVKDVGVLMLPGTMFNPADIGNGRSEMRIAFANIDRQGITELFNRLSNL